MKHLILQLGTTLAAISISCQAATILQPGLWELKLVHHEIDGKDQTAIINDYNKKAQGAATNMAPETRAKFDAMTRNKNVIVSPAGSPQFCISAAMAASGLPVMIDENIPCAPTLVAQNGNTTKFALNCKTPNGSITGNGESTVKGNSIDTKENVTITKAHSQHITLTEVQMTFLGTNCQGLIPLDNSPRKP